jgi:hypothetical protein
MSSDRAGVPGLSTAASINGRFGGACGLGSLHATTNYNVQALLAALPAAKSFLPHQQCQPWQGLQLLQRGHPQRCGSER